MPGPAEPDPNALEAPLRMQLALPRFGVAPPLDDRFLRWIATPVASDPRPGLGVTFDSTHDRVEWWTRHLPPTGAPAGTDQGGAWIGHDSTTEDEGWYVAGTISLDEALAGGVEIHHPSRAAVEDWVRSTDSTVARADYCTAGRPHVQLAFALSGDDSIDQVMNGLDLFRALGVDGPPQATLGPILNATGDVLAVVGLLPNGLRAAGFSAHLDEEQMIRLLVATDESTVVASGETMGVLGAEAPESVAVLNTNAGVRVLLEVYVG